MNQCSLYHLVILFEQKYVGLSDTVIYSSPSLPAPFVIATDHSLFDPAHLGNRTCSKISVEYYQLSDFSSVNMVSNSPIEDSIVFRSGNPTVETTEGVIHVYKNANEVQLSVTGITSTMLCIFSVPSCITVRDLLNFVSPMRESIEELKIVKSDSFNHYMALLKFRSEGETEQFYNTFNNTCYRNLESELCQLMYVSHVDTTNPSKGTAFPTKDLVELPACPVCLERLDEPVQGILTTILCNHTFHDNCIARVEDASCPVCRYVQSPELLDDSQCADCYIRENLWICLICGRIGCGRYGQKHAYRHFEETGHTFALELGKNLVWDYADDAYVHRLALNHEDGKLVQVGSGSETGDKKMDMLTVEFGAVLTSQLESQRAYFEGQLERIALESTERFQVAECKIKDLTSRLDTTQEKLAAVTKEKSALTRKVQQMTTLVQRLQNDLEEEKALNERLLANEVIWRSRSEQAEADAKKAQEECKELLLNLEFRSKLDELASVEQISTEELAGSNITIQEKPSKHRRRRKR